MPMPMKVPTQQDVDRRRAIAEALMRQQMPQGQQAGRFYVAPSPFAQLAGGLTNAIGQYQGLKAGQEQGELNKDNARKISEALASQGADPQTQQAISSLPPEQQGGVLGKIIVDKLTPKPVSQRAPVITRGPDGKPRYSSAEDAIGQQPYEKPELPPGMRQGPTGEPEFIPGYIEGQTQIRRAGAPATNVSLNTEKSLYGTLAEKQAGQYSDLYAQAQAAPERIDRAARVRALLQSQPITGAGAEQKLAIAKGLKSLGLYDSEDIANTELLIREFAGSTLEAIKSSGLGGGNGFSNADRDFLEKVTGGRITLDAKSLERTAELNERSARAILKRWNETSKRLKPDQLQNLGMSPIDLPPELPQTSGQVNGIKDLLKDPKYSKYFQQ